MATTAASLMLQALSGSISRGGGAMGKAAGMAQAGAGTAAKATAGAAGMIGGNTGHAVKATIAMHKDIAEHLPSLGKGFKTKVMPNVGSVLKNLVQLPKKLFSKTMGLMGLNLSISAMLRQSQIFTGFMGALFQIIGGFVDVILAPFMPFFVGLMRKLAAWIPVVREYAQKVYDWLAQNIFPKLREWGNWFGEKVRELFGGALDALPAIQAVGEAAWNEFKPVLDGYWELVKSVGAWALETVGPVVISVGQGIWDIAKFAWNWAKDVAWPFLKSIGGSIISIIEQVANWISVDVVPRLTWLSKWLIEEAGGFILWVTDTFFKWIDDMVPTFTSIFNQIFDLVKSIVVPLWDALEPVLKWVIGMYLQSVKRFLKFIDKYVLPTLQKLANIIMPAFQMLSDTFMKHFAPAIEKIVNGMWDIIEKAWVFLEPIVLLLARILVWGVKNILVPVLEDIALMISTYWDIIKPSIDWLFDNIFNWDKILDYVVNPFLEWGARVMNRINNTIWLFKNFGLVIKTVWLDSIKPGLLKAIDSIPLVNITKAVEKAEREGQVQKNLFNEAWDLRRQVEARQIILDPNTNEFNITINNRDDRNFKTDESRESIVRRNEDLTIDNHTQMTNMLSGSGNLLGSIG